MTYLEEELRQIVPLDEFVDLSTVPALYLIQFGRKLTLPPGCKISKFVKSLPHAFEVDNSKQCVNKTVTYWRIKQLPVQRQEPRMSTTTTPPPASQTLLSQHSTVRTGKSKLRTPKSATPKTIFAKDPSHSPLELNERGEVTVSLLQLTASLHKSQIAVPIGGLAAFICAKKATNQAKEGTSLITDEKMGGV